MLEEKVKRFFEILDIKEESDSGREFSPVYIVSLRVLLTQELGQLLNEMKVLSGYKNRNVNPRYIHSHKT